MGGREIYRAGPSTVASVFLDSGVIFRFSFVTSGRGKGEDIGHRRLQAGVVPTHQPNSRRWLHSDIGGAPGTRDGSKSRKFLGVGCTPKRRSPQVPSLGLQVDNDTPMCFYQCHGGRPHLFGVFVSNIYSTETNSHWTGDAKGTPRHFTSTFLPRPDVP